MPTKGQPKKVKNKKLSKNKKKFFRGLVYFVFILFLLSLISLVIYGIYFLRNNKRFNIKNITVNELEHYSYEEIVSSSGMALGQNIFKISKSDAINNILKLPYVESVNITKKLPSTINIKVSERVGKYVAYAKDSGEYVRLDAKGYVLEIVPVAEISEELLLFGINFEDVIELGYRLTDTELDKIASFEKIICIYNENKIDAKVTSVEFKNALVILNLNDKLNVCLKDNSELEYKISFLKTILQEIDGKNGVLDMTQDNPTYSAI